MIAHRIKRLWSRDLRTYLSQKKKDLQYLDVTVLVLAGLLSLIGLVFIYSASIGLAENSFHYILRQFSAFLLGVMAVLVIYLIPYDWLEDTRLLTWATRLVISLLLTVSLLGLTAGGAQSWLPLGSINFQPSEFAKILIILIMARFNADNSTEEILSLKKSRPNAFKRLSSWVKDDSDTWWNKARDWVMDNVTLVTILMIIALIAQEPDTGTAILIAAIAFLLLSIYQLTIKQLTLSTSILVGLASLIVFVANRWFKDTIAAGDSHVLKRMISFSDPYHYPDTLGYQLIQGLKSFARGGWWGVGLGQGAGHLREVPEIHTDFILSVIGEEAGLISVLFIVGLLFALAIRLIYLAQGTGDIFRATIISGAGILLFLQSTVNILGIIGLIPLTGVPLPFVSYGGSSLLASWLLIGLVQVALIKERKKLEIQRRERKGVYEIYKS